MSGVLKNVQALRALAATSVIFVHLQVLMDGHGFGGGGVDLFFVISGFVMVHSTLWSKMSAGTFLKRRAQRIVPLYWFCTLGVVALSFFAPKLLNSTTFDMVQVVKSLLFIPFMKGSGLVAPVLFVGWSLNYEMFFYALFALGMLLPSRQAGVYCVAAVLWALWVVGGLAPNRGVLLGFYTNPIILEFALGMLIALAAPKLPKRPTTAMVIGAGLLLLGAPVIVFENLIWPDFPGVFFSGPLAMAVVFGAVALETWGYAVTWRPVLLLGEASYALYLSHPYVTQVFQKILTRHASPLLVPVVVAATFVVAVVVHKLIEAPLNNLVRARFPVRRGALAAAA